MSQQPGWAAQLVGQQETAFGEDPTSVTGQILPIISHTLKADEPPIENEVIRGRRDAALPDIGPVNVGGDVVVPLEIGNLGWWMAMAFGGTGPMYKVGSTQPSAVLADQNATAAAYAKYNGCMISRIQFRFAPGQQLRATFTIIGASEGNTQFAASPTAATALVPILFKDLTFSEADTAFAGCTEFTCDIDFGLSADQYPIGAGGYRTSILPGRAKVTGQVTAFLDSDGAGLWTKANAGTETTLSVEGVPATGKSFKIELFEAKLHRPTKDLAGPTGRLLQFQYTAYYNDPSADNSIVRVTVDNATE